MLNGKIALVTGASRGIGSEIAKVLAKDNAYVYVNYNGSEEKAAKVLSDIKEAGGDGELLKGNVADFSQAKEMIDTIMEKSGKLDILVNNAGVTKDELILRMTEEDYDKVVDTNLKGTFNMCKHAAKYMLKARCGRIVNMSSIVGVNGNAGQINYAASKAGIIGLTKSLAKELGSRGITVNAIAPGFIETEMTDVLKEESKKKILEQIPAKRMGTVTDIANTVEFLVSDKASYVTGQVIGVDGGMTF